MFHVVDVKQQFFGVYYVMADGREEHLWNLGVRETSVQRKRRTTLLLHAAAA
jgi:hypothetical protein